MPASSLSLTFIIMSWKPSFRKDRGTADRERLIPLPRASNGGVVSVERAIADRRSTRRFAPAPLTVDELSQLLWAGQGLRQVAEERRPAPGTREPPGGYRTAPSAGALFPLELYAVIGTAVDLGPGVYHYLPMRHGLQKTADGDLRRALWDVALQQDAIRSAPVSIVIAAVVERTAVKYGDRAERYVLVEVGAAAENIALQAGALGLGAVLIGAFQDKLVNQVLSLPRDQDVVGMMPVGHPLST